MKIYVCVKQIPDPNTVVSKLDPDTKRLVRSGVSLVLVVMGAVDHIHCHTAR